MGKKYMTPFLEMRGGGLLGVPGMAPADALSQKGEEGCGVQPVGEAVLLRACQTLRWGGTPGHGVDLHRATNRDATNRQV